MPAPYTDITFTNASEGGITAKKLNKLRDDLSTAISGGGTGTGDMTKAVYDTNNNGKVDTCDAVPWTGVTGKPSTFPPDSTAMLKSVYDINGDGISDHAALADTAPWSGITGKPATFPPDSTAMLKATYDVNGNGVVDTCDSLAWGKLTGVPATFPPDSTAMLKSVYDTNGDGISDHAALADTAPWTGITGKPATFPPSAHAASHLDNGSDVIPVATTSRTGLAPKLSGTATTYLNGAGAFTTPASSVTDYVRVADFGAVGDGVTDDTAAIQAAINSLPNDGGIVLFGVKNYKISSTLTIGNGTTSALSTKHGVILLGAGIPNTPTGVPSLNGYTAAVGPKLTWAGGAFPMISVKGPLQGWGIQNLFLDGASITGVYGISVISAQFGDSANLTIQNCFVGIASSSNPLGGYTGVGNVDALRNRWTNIWVYVPAVTGAKGIFLNGDTGGTSDTDYNNFTNIFIRSPSAATNYGLYLGVNDGNVFHNIAISGFSAPGYGMYFDYSLNTNFPNNNTFYSYEICSFGTTGAAGTTPITWPHRFYGWIGDNGAPAPTIASTEAAEGPWITFTPGLTWSGTATFTVNSAKYKTLGKTTQIEIDFTISASGTLSNSISFNLPNTPASGAALAGMNQNTGIVAAGVIKAGNTSAQVLQVGQGNWALGNRSSFSGVYENQ